jgi:hypothetical protein
MHHILPGFCGFSAFGEVPGRVAGHQGDPVNRFYLILSGSVELTSESRTGHAIPVRATGTEVVESFVLLQGGLKRHTTNTV